MSNLEKIKEQIEKNSTINTNYSLIEKLIEEEIYRKFNTEMKKLLISFKLDSLTIEELKDLRRFIQTKKDLF